MIRPGWGDWRRTRPPSVARQSESAIANGLDPKTTHSLRTVLLSGSDYKARLSDRGMASEVTRLLRLSHLPHYVWVVEAHDRAARDAGDPCVVAELVYDSTSSDESPRNDAVVLPLRANWFPPDQAERPPFVVNSVTHWRSNISNH